MKPGKTNKPPAPELRRAVDELLEYDFGSDLVRYLRATGYEYVSGDIQLRLAAEFGFCYGVDRAVEYAFAARYRFPDRRIYLTGEIIHNPRVNRRLAEMGFRFLPAGDAGEARYRDLAAGDVVVIPAFGADAREMAYLLDRGFEIVDTTCGSVLNVWKRVRLYAEREFTSVIHGKHDHEETIATCSQVTAARPDGAYLVVRDLHEAEALAEMIAEADFSAFSDLFPAARASRRFEPERDLERIGLANQTTMLESESRTIQAVLKSATARRYGDEDLNDHFLAFDTICSATEDRQKAVDDLIAGGVDRMIVIGGFNSSNTGHLLEISLGRVSAYHIESAECLLDRERIRAKPENGEPEIMKGWLPAGPQVVGITGGASTPDSVVGRVISRVLELGGGTPPSRETIRATLEGI